MKIPDVEKKIGETSNSSSPELKAPDLNTLRPDAREMHLKQQKKIKLSLKREKSKQKDVPRTPRKGLWRRIRKSLQK